MPLPTRIPPNSRSCRALGRLRQSPSGIRLVLLLLMGVSPPARGQTVDSDRLLDALRALPGAVVKEIDPSRTFTRAFEIWLPQPIDHDNPGNGRMYQRMFLSHRDLGRPMVLVTEGYAATWTKTLELAVLLEANQLIVEHRYFGVSKPESEDWTYLTVRQSATDVHRIVELLRPLYRGKWVSTGKSKGGMAALFHRVFYPGDVDATVAYAAPIMTSTRDPRFVSFLERVGNEVCRMRIRDYQRHMLERRTELISLLDDWADTRSFEFTVGVDSVFEYAVVQYPYSFWQSGGVCGEVPGLDTADSLLLSHLDSVVGFRNYDAATLDREAALIYQAATEIGYHGFPTAHIADLLTSLPDPDYSMFSPTGNKPPFDPLPVQEVLVELQRNGEGLILLYGQNDPWTACAVELAPESDALKIVVPGVSHEFEWGDLPSSSRDRISQMLTSILELAEPIGDAPR